MILKLWTDGNCSNYSDRSCHITSILIWHCSVYPSLQTVTVTSVSPIHYLPTAWCRPNRKCNCNTTMAASCRARFVLILPSMTTERRVPDAACRSKSCRDRWPPEVNDAGRHHPKRLWRGAQFGGALVGRQEEGCQQPLMILRDQADEVDTAICLQLWPP